MDDSGWYIGPEDQARALGSYEAILVYQLLALRPALMKVLALPVGYLVVCDRNRIEAILNEMSRFGARREVRQDKEGAKIP